MVKSNKDYVIGNFTLRHVSGKTIVRRRTEGPEPSLVPTGELYADETVKQILCELIERIEGLEREVARIHSGDF